MKRKMFNVMRIKWGVRIICGLMLLVKSWSICPSQTVWTQRQFILGTFYDPPYDFTKQSLKDDSAKFQLAKDANFNLLTGTEGDGAINHSYEGMMWALKVAKCVGLHYLVSDNRIYEAYNHRFDIQVARDLVNQYKRVPSELQNSFYGFTLCDEPQNRLNHFENVTAWKTFLESTFPDKLGYINLAPSYGADQNWGGFTGGNRDGILNELEKNHYEKYLDMYVDSLHPAIVSFDHYPFFRNGDIRRDYFYNLKVIRSKSAGRPFWACPMTIDHYNYIDPQEAHVLFMFFCPIAYGAKGLITFTFWPAFYTGYRSSLFDRQGNKTFRYELVRKLNLYIEKVLAPVVMNVAQIEIYHASSFPNNQLFIDDEINADSSLISSVSDEKIMLGIFKNQKKFYLFVVNKSLNTISQTRISMKGSFSFVELAPRVIGFDQNTSTQYIKLRTEINAGNTITSFTIPELSGGEGRLIKISMK